MERTNISHMRPAHIHFAITAPGYDTCVTHLFQQGDEFIETDVVYGVKAPLIVEFVKKPPGKAPTGETLVHAVLRGEVRLRAAAEGGGARRRGVTGHRHGRSTCEVVMPREGGASSSRRPL